MTYCSIYFVTPRNGRRSSAAPSRSPPACCSAPRGPRPRRRPAQLAGLMVDRRVPATARLQRLVPVPRVGVHHRPGGGGATVVSTNHRPAPPPHPRVNRRFPPTTRDRRPVGVPGAVPMPVGPPSRRSSRSVCGTPFSPRSGTSRRPRPRRPAAASGPPSAGRETGSRAAARAGAAAGPEFAGQLAVGIPWTKPQDQQDRGEGAVGPLPGGAGEQVEHPAAGLAPLVDDRGPWRRR